MLNTIKATLRYGKAFFDKYVPLKSRGGSVEDVLNYLRYSDTFSSSGQPTKHQFSLIQQAGYQVVINLAPYDLIENPLKEEENIVKNLGMQYFHIPVNFLKPVQRDFDAFVAVMQNVAGKKVWVHCAANMSATAFIYRYRCSVLGEDPDKALWDMREIWEPFGPWKKFAFSDKVEV